MLFILVQEIMTPTLTLVRNLQVGRLEHQIETNNKMDLVQDQVNIMLFQVNKVQKLQWESNQKVMDYNKMYLDLEIII